VIAKVSARQAVYPPLNGNPSLQIFKLVEPLLIEILTRRGEIMADFH
jgi:hypothetical protein